MSETKEAVRVGISCGDLNGIGIEVVLKTFEDARMFGDLVPVLYAPVKAVSHHRKALGIGNNIFNGHVSSVKNHLIETSFLFR